ncbi:MAG TPA: P-II family nitrogen regulator [Fimbriimonadaceae bacterium]|nr:P-II family nitrogen regulator [Fimbriimonadaceae bacterium]HRJ97435.1 P-II family nitrogen regulator [Fimbriimonadaceae bacterium]
MVRITAFVRPHRLEEVKLAVAGHEITGLSVSDVRGTGNSPERAVWLGGYETLVALPIRSKIVVFAREDQAEELVEAIVHAARTGEPGDGKIFVEPVTDAIRIRTGERGATGL